MLTIQYGEAREMQATFSSDTMKWLSSDKIMQDILNNNVPTSVDMRIGHQAQPGPQNTRGVDGIALSKLKHLGGKIKVINYKQDPLLVEIEGEIY